MSPARRTTPIAVWILLGGQLLTKSMGFAYPFMTFLLRSRGYGTSTTGHVLGVFGAGWIVGQLLFGALADRIGRRSTLLVTMLVAAATLPVLATAHTLTAIATAAGVTGVVYDASRPVISAALTDLLPTNAERVKGIGWLYWCNNIGAAVVGAAGGLLASRLGVSNLLWINAGSCALFAAVIFRYLPAETHGGAGPQGRYRQALADQRLWLLNAASLCAFIPILGAYSALPLLMNSDKLSATAFGIVQCCNAVTVIVLTPHISRWLSRIATGPTTMTQTVAAGAIVLGLGMGAASLAHTTLGYAAGVVMSIPGEICFLVAAPGLLAQIAPPDLRGRYNGAWGMTAAMASSIAPLMTSWALGHGGRPAVAATTLATGTLAAVICLPLAHLTAPDAARTDLSAALSAPHKS